MPGSKKSMSNKAYTAKKKAKSGGKRGKPSRKVAKRVKRKGIVIGNA